MSAFISKLKYVTAKYPLLRGMLSYSMIWPTSALIQQTIAGKNWGIYFIRLSKHNSIFLPYYFNTIMADTIDWGKCLRFSVYGALFVAPTLYAWIRVSTAMWPHTSLRNGAIKVSIVY